MKVQFNQIFLGLSIIIAASIIAVSDYITDTKVSQKTNKPGKIDEAWLDAKIEKGIEKFIQKQQDQARQQREQRAAQIAKNAKSMMPVSQQRDHIYGNPNAELTIIEYTDVECPFCKRFHDVPKKLVEKYEGRVNWVLRHFPLGFHDPAATQGAMAAECVSELSDTETFFKFVDEVFDKTQTNGKGVPGDGLVGIAKEFNIDADAFNTCVSSQKYLARVKEDMASGEKIGVTGTPATFLVHHGSGDIEFINGAWPLEMVDEKLMKLLAK